MSVRAWLTASSLVSRGIREADLDSDPWVVFQQWFGLAGRIGLPMPNAMTLTTVSVQGGPTARTVLLKDHGPNCGLVFFTNYQSRKASELEAEPRCCLLLHWHIIQRQIRIEGIAERVAADVSDAYFASRPRGSQLSAWASHQSRPVENEQAMRTSMEQIEQRFADGPVPRPDFWGGYRVWPRTMEFWQGRAFRFHDRFVYTRQPAGDWTRQRLYP